MPGKLHLDIDEAQTPVVMPPCRVPIALKAKLKAELERWKAIVFGVEHHHTYIYGREITLWTDHKPLVSIISKPLASAPKRLQRLLLRLQSFLVKICYKPGKEMVLADTLSRACLPTSKRQKSETEEEVETIHMINHLPISEPQLKEIQRETTCDTTLQSLKETILKGWPENKEKLPQCIIPTSQLEMS